MIGNDPQRVTSYRRQDPPANTPAAFLYSLVAQAEFRTPHKITWAANKASEVNAFNSPYTPSMVVRVYPGLKHPAMTSRLLSKPIMLLNGGGRGNI